MRIKIGTRKSKLALIQTEIVISELKKVRPDIEYVVTPITTKGDKILDRNLYDIGGKALFLKELEEKLLCGEIDMAVHSMKDVPGILPEGCKIMAVLEREDPRDCFISLKYKSILDLPENSVVGTSSVRRKAIIQAMRPDLKLVMFRGNVNTRLEKLKSGIVDATILACSGLKRAGLFDESFCFPIESSEMIPAVGQGVICVEGRAADQDAQDLCNLINHLPTANLLRAERSFLSYLNASCDTPMGAYARYEEGKVKASYMLASADSKRLEFYHATTSIDHAEKLGVDAAKRLLEAHTS